MSSQLADIAMSKCSKFDDLADILSEFSAVCPAVMTGLDESFFDNVKAFHAQLKCNKEIRELPSDNFLQGGDELYLDGRFDDAGNPVSICCNPALMSELWNATVVYISNPTKVKDVASMLIRQLASISAKMCVIIPNADHQDITYYEDIQAESNISVYSSNLSGRDFADKFPKITGTFWCLAESLNDCSNDVTPGGGNRRIWKNVFVVTEETDAKFSTSLDHRKSIVDKGYSRVLFRNGSIVTDKKQDESVLDFCLPIGGGHSEELTRYILQFHENFDNKKAGHAIFLNHVLLLDSFVQFPNDPSESLAIFALENRKNPILVKTIRVSYAKSRSSAIVMLVCNSSKQVSEFYQRELSSFCKNVRVVSLPARFPFLKEKAFSISAYSRMMTSIEMWDLVKANLPSTVSHVLTIQEDGCIQKKISKNMVQKYTSKFDYIGAPWHDQNLPHLKKLCPGMVGNGGISIRSLSACIAVVNDEGSAKLRKTLLNNTFDMPEDVFFVHNMLRLGFKVSPKTIAEEFSVEQIMSDDSYGTHKPWLYHGLDVLKKFFSSAEESEVPI